MRLIFARNKHLLSYLIQREQWGEWSHVGIIDGDFVIEARGIPVLPLILIIFGVIKNSLKYGGVTRTPMAEFLSRYHVTHTAYINGSIDSARTHIGTMFDGWGILGIFFKRRIHCDDKVFCSKLVALCATNYRDKLAYKATVENIYAISRDTP